MMLEAIAGSYATAFLLGLFSTVHCIAMCGSVIGALTLSLPAEIRQNQLKTLPFVFNYNIGRLISYGLAGAFVGVISSPLAEFNGHLVLRYLSVFVMIAMGFYLAGWFPKFAQMERMGAPIWRRLQPISRKLIPVRKLPQAFLLGAVWGWLPCGLVYAALAVSATTGNATHGALTMLAFGVGTLPAVMGAGLFTGLIAGMAKATYFRKLAGLTIVAMALFTLIWPMDHAMHSHQHHEQHNHNHH